MTLVCYDHFRSRNYMTKSMKTTVCLFKRRVLSCILRNIYFLFHLSSHLERIFPKRYACGILYAADFEILKVKVGYFYYTAYIKSSWWSTALIKSRAVENIM